MHALVAIVAATLRSLPALFRSQQDQAIVELALRQQLAIYGQKQRRPRLSPLDRAFGVGLSRLWPRWKTAPVVVQPETVVRWQRRRFRSYWRRISSPGPGRPAIPEETQRLIVRMANENGWRARRIQGELAMLGIRVGLATISRYLPKPEPDPRSRQGWITFLRNHSMGSRQWTSSWCRPPASSCSTRGSSSIMAGDAFSTSTSRSIRRHVG